MRPRIAVNPIGMEVVGNQAPMTAMLDAGARLLRRSKPPALTNWITASMGRDRSYDITAARRELGYEPRVPLADGLAAMSTDRGIR